MAKIERRTLYSETVDLITKASTTVKIDIPRDKFIRRIILRQHGDINLKTGSANAIPSPAPSLIDKVRLIRDGSETIVSADPAYLMVMDYMEHGGSVNAKIPHTVSNVNSQTWYSSLSLDFMVNPMNPGEVFLYDEGTGQVFTVMLPAMDYSSLRLEIDVAANTATAMDGLYDTVPSSYDGGTAELDVTLEEVFMEQGDPVITRDNVYELRTIQNEKTLEASADALPYEITTGVLMRRMALFQYDDSLSTNPKRPAQEKDNDGTYGLLVERVKVKQTSPISWTMLDEHFESLQEQDLLEYNVDSMEQIYAGVSGTANFYLVMPEDREVGVFKGFTVLDFDNGRNLSAALDLTGMKSGDIKMFMKTTAAATTSDKMYVIEHYMI
jgi:hypothetical protein